MPKAARVAKGRATFRGARDDHRSLDRDCLRTIGASSNTLLSRSSGSVRDLALSIRRSGSKDSRPVNSCGKPTVIPSSAPEVGE